MPLLIQTRRWRDRKPNGPQEIDWSHPLARGLKFFLLVNARAGAPRNLVSGAFLGSNFDWVLDDEGVGIKQAASLETTTPYVPTAYPFTINARWRPYIASGTSTTEGVGFVGAASARHIAFGLRNKASDKNSYNVFLGGTDPAITHGTTDPVSNLVVVDTTGVSKSATDHELYWLQDAAVTSTVSAGTNFSMDRFRVMGGTESPTVYHFGAWDRALTADEIAWLHAEPYAMLRPRRRRLFTVVSGGAKSGSVALSGAGILAVVARKGVVASIGVTARPVLALVASKGAIAASVLGAIGVVSVLGQAVRQGAVSVTAAATISSTEASARLATAVLSAGGFLVVSGSTLTGNALEGQIRLSGVDSRTSPVLGQADVQLALAGDAARIIPLKGRLS